MRVYRRHAAASIRSKDRGLAVLRVVVGFVFFMHGFFAPDGVELVLLLLVSTVTLILADPGALALDGLLARPRAGR